MPLSEGASFCRVCGRPQSGPPPLPPETPPGYGWLDQTLRQMEVQLRYPAKKIGLAGAGLVLLSVFLPWLGLESTAFPWLLALLAFICAAVALAPRSGRTQVVMGAVMCISLIILSINPNQVLNALGIEVFADASQRTGPLVAFLGGAVLTWSGYSNWRNEYQTLVRSGRSPSAGRGQGRRW
jgi:hypothetical protein